MIKKFKMFIPGVNHLMLVFTLVIYTCQFTFQKWNVEVGLNHLQKIHAENQKLNVNIF